MARYINLVLTYPRTVLIILLFITIFLTLGIPRLEFDSSLDVMMPQHDEEYLNYQDFKETYGNIGNFVIMNVTAENVWSPDFFVEMNNLVADIEEYKTYDKSRETQRLVQLIELLDKKDITTGELIGSYAGDAPFQRALSRCLKKIDVPIGPCPVTRTDVIKKEIRRMMTLKQGRYVKRIISALTAKDIRGHDNSFSAVEITETNDEGQRILPVTPEDMERFKERLTHNPAYNRALYARDRKTGEITDFCILVNLANVKEKEDAISREIWDISTSFPSISVTPQGVPIVNKFMNDYMLHDLKTFLPLVLLVVSIVFLFNFKSFRGLILPFVSLVLTDVWTIGLMGHLGKKMSVVEVSLPTLLVAVGSSYSIHIINQYYIDFDAISKEGRFRGLAASMSHISVTVLLAGLTTFFGFISLTTNQITGIREWGLFSAIGVIFAVIITTSLIPAALRLMPHKRVIFSGIISRVQRESIIERITGLFTVIAIKHSRSVIAVTGIIIIVSVLGITKLRVETAFMAYFKEKDYMRTSSILIGQKYGGSVGTSILIDSGELDGIYDPSFLNTIDSIREWLVAENNNDLYVGRTDAFTDVIKSMHMAIHNDDPDYFRIPENRMDVRDYMEIYGGNDRDSDGRIDDFESYFDRDMQTAMIFAKVWEGDKKYHSTTYIKYIQNRIDRYLSKTLPEKYTYTITGEPSIMIRLSDHVISGQLQSLLFCFIAVIIIIILLFKNWKAGAVAMIPMSVAVIINFGIMGWFGIRLDTATAIIASLTIGIGVDDTIHFLNSFRHFKKQNYSVDQSITGTLAVTGKAISYTSLALIFGFSILVFSNYKPIIFFGVLSALTMVATTLGALIILPAVIKFTGVSLEESSSHQWFWRYAYIGRFFNIEQDTDNKLRN